MALAKLEDNSKRIGEALDLQLQDVEKLFPDFFSKCSKSFNKRAAIVKGVGEAAKAKKAEDDEDGLEEDEEEVGVPSFWLTAMQNDVRLTEMVSRDDEDVLQDLEDVTVKPQPGGGLKLEFTFAKNDYFTNRTLSKTYTIHGKDAKIRIEGTEIDWKPNMNYTVKTVGKGGNKKGAKGKVDKDGKQKQKRQASFFHFFACPQEQYVKSDLDLSSHIKESLVPHAYSYFMDCNLLGPHRDLNDDDQNEDMLSFSVAVQERLKNLKDIQETINKFYTVYQEKKDETVAKHANTMKGLYEERCDILSSEMKSNPDSALSLFWLTALKNHDDVRQIIRTADLDVLAYLRDVRVEHNMSNMTYQAEFEFNKNPYFTESVLKMSNVASSPPSTISWSEGKNVSQGKRGPVGFFSLFTYLSDPQFLELCTVVLRTIYNDVVPHAYTLYQKGEIELSEEEEVEDAVDSYEEELARAEDLEAKRKKIGSAARKAEKSPAVPRQTKLILFVLFMLSAEVIMFFSGMGMHGPPRHSEL